MNRRERREGGDPVERLQEEARWSRYRFVLENQGPAAADDVSFEIRTLVEGEAPFVQMEGHSFPIRLDPKQEYEMGCIPPHGTALLWTWIFGGRMAPGHGPRH